MVYAHPDSSNRLRRSHITQYRCEGMLQLLRQELPLNAAASEYTPGICRLVVWVRIMGTGTGMGTRPWVWVRVRVRDHGYGYGYETMGMGTGTTCDKVMGTGMGTRP